MGHMNFISSWENRNVASGSLWSDSRIDVLEFDQHLQSPSASSSLSEGPLGNVGFDKASRRISVESYCLPLEINLRKSLMEKNEPSTHLTNYNYIKGTERNYLIIKILLWLKLGKKPKVLEGDS